MNIDFSKQVSEQRTFGVHNGSVLRTLDDLYSALTFMDDATFTHHVSSDRNDFGAWIIHALEYKSLGEEISKLHSRMQIKKALDKHRPKKLLDKVIPPKLPPVEQNASVPMRKIEEIIEREKIIEKKEEKIREIEEKIDGKIDQIKNNSSSKFFTKEFSQGLIVGFLAAIVILLLYVRVFA